MKLWVDDVRPAPDASWEVATTAAQAIQSFLEMPLANIELISLDHDLGEEETGYDIAKWIEHRTAMNYNYFPPFILCHSDNPVGRKNIMECAAAIERLLEDGIRTRTLLLA